MATAAGAAGRNPIISLVPQVNPAGLPKVTLRRNVINAGVSDKRRREVVTYLSDEFNVEQLLRLVKDFKQTWDAPRLHLDSGALRIQYFRTCLGGYARDKWDIEVAAVGGTSTAHFDTALNNFIRRYIKPTDLYDQKKYLENAVKPATQNCLELAARLETILSLMKLFENHANNDEVYTEQEKKFLYYNMMPDEWKMVFLTTTSELTDATYTFRDLVTFMHRQELRCSTKRKATARTGAASRGRSKRDGGELGAGNGGHYAGQRRQSQHQGGRPAQRGRYGGRTQVTQQYPGYGGDRAYADPAVAHHQAYGRGGGASGDQGRGPYQSQNEAAVVAVAVPDEFSNPFAQSIEEYYHSMDDWQQPYHASEAYYEEFENPCIEEQFGEYENTNGQERYDY